MQSRAHLQRINRAADSAIETPSGTHRDFFRRRKDRQRPFRESSRAAYSTESPCQRFLPRVCFLADRPLQSLANKEQSLRIYESKISRINVGSAPCLGETAGLFSSDLCQLRQSAIARPGRQHATRVRSPEAKSAERISLLGADFSGGELSGALLRTKRKRHI